MKRWLVKARHDWSVAEQVLTSGGEETDVAAFHCQQAVEKMLKGYLVSRGIEFGKTHDLGRLLDHCADSDTQFDALRDDVEPLTLYAVAFRYPGPGDPSQEDVESALRVVERVWAFLKNEVPDEVLP